MNFLIVDDHSLIRAGLSLLLTSVYPGVKCSEAANEKQASRMVVDRNFQLIFLDITMPDSDISRLIACCKKHQPRTPILILTMSDERSFAQRFLKMGVEGYVHKSAENGVILEAVRTVLDKRIYMSEALRESLLTSVIKQSSDNPFEKLSNREFQVIRELLLGKTIAEIAIAQGIAPSTVSTYKGKAYEKLGVKHYNFIELMSLAKANGVI